MKIATTILLLSLVVFGLAMRRYMNTTRMESTAGPYAYFQIKISLKKTVYRLIISYILLLLSTIFFYLSGGTS